MTVYWTMFAVPAAVRMLFGRETAESRSALLILLAALLGAFVILIGLRWEVGGDWFNYESIVRDISLETLGSTLRQGDPGFGLVAWISTRTGTDSFLTSLFCGGVLVWGLWRFAREQDDPWLTVTAAVPYLLIVVGMGYVRQAAAIGFLLLALVQFQNLSYGHFLKWMALAISFHVTALALIPLLGAVLARRRILLLIPLGALSVGAYLLTLSPRLEAFNDIYVDAQLDSSGALVRLVMNAIPAAIFIVLRRRFDLPDHMRALWTIFALVSLLLVVVVGVAPSSTIIDRVGLYFIPIQLFVFGNLSRALGLKGAGEGLVAMGVIAFYASVLFVWLNYAAYAPEWLPYRFLPFEA